MACGWWWWCPHRLFKGKKWWTESWKHDDIDIFASQIEAKRIKKPWPDTAMLLCKEVWSVMHCLYGAASCVLSVGAGIYMECIPDCQLSLGELGRRTLRDWLHRGNAEICCLMLFVFEWRYLPTCQAKRNTGGASTDSPSKSTLNTSVIPARCPGGGWVDSRQAQFAAKASGFLHFKYSKCPFESVWVVVRLIDLAKHPAFCPHTAETSIYIYHDLRTVTWC